MNEICKTSSRTQKTYYITNCSMHSELQEIIKESFKQVGFDNVYFVSTTDKLEKNGWY